MSVFKNIINKIIPVAKTVGTIVVHDNATGTAMAAAGRILANIAASSLATHGVITGSDQETVAGMLVTLTVSAYGLLKTIKEKKEKIAAADPLQPADLLLIKK